MEGEIDRLRSLSLEELRGEWRRLHQANAPKISRDLLVLGLGYKLQEIEQGGLGRRQSASWQRWRRPCGQRAGSARCRASA